MDKEIYDKLANYCAYQERCLADVKQKLAKLKVPKEDYPLYTAKLITDNFLNEERYVKYFVAGHAKKRWGKTKIKAALAVKKLDSAIVKKYLDDIDEEGYDEQLKATALKKWNTLRTGTPREKKTKLLRFLLSKGYEMKKASDAIKEIE